MKVNPITETEAAQANLWKRGIYDFETVEAEELVSKSGNDMIKLQTRVYNAEGKYRVIFDYLVSSEGMAYKVRHFASATGLLPQYERGELRALDCVTKSGRCQLGIEKGRDNYPDKNVITDYVPAVAKGLQPPLIDSMATEEIDDEIPF